MSLKLEGDGHTVGNNGVVRIFEDQVYLCDLNLVDLLREFTGQWVEIMIASPQPPLDKPVDEKIKPLVEALQNRGIVTLSSCEGHIFGYPFVSMWNEPTIPIARGWDLIKIGTNVWRLKGGEIDAQVRILD